VRTKATGLRKKKEKGHSREKKKKFHGGTKHGTGVRKTRDAAVTHVGAKIKMAERKSSVREEKVLV